MSKNLAKSFGIGSFALKIMADLVHQVETQGGSDEDMKYFSDPIIISRIAKVLVRYSRFIRTMGQSFNGISFIAAMDDTFGTINNVPFLQYYNWLSKSDMGQLLKDFPDLFQDEELILVGELIDYDGDNMKFWAMSKDNGIYNLVVGRDTVIDDKYRLAVKKV